MIIPVPETVTAAGYPAYSLGKFPFYPGKQMAHGPGISMFSTAPNSGAMSLIQ